MGLGREVMELGLEISGLGVPAEELESASAFFGFLVGGFPLLCVLTCLARWSDRMNRLLQVGHEKRFSPVWVRRWRCNSSDRVNRLPQNSQLQMNGRSPVCHLKRK